MRKTDEEVWEAIEVIKDLGPLHPTVIVAAVLNREKVCRALETLSDVPANILVRIVDPISG